jgi:hypothetical protein
LISSGNSSGKAMKVLSFNRLTRFRADEYKARLRHAWSKLDSSSEDLAWGLKIGVLIGAAALMLGLPPVNGTRGVPASAQVQMQTPGMANTTPEQSLSLAPQATGPRHADFADASASPSPEARRVADWIADSRDNRGMPFVILDKRGARVFAFDRDANLKGSTLVLLGSAKGDDSAPGIGDRPLAEIRSDERTTPAGRFVSAPGHDVTGEDVVWVDYDNSVAMHRVKVVDPKEHRFERIATPSIDDKRISNGCINVPIAFYDSMIAPVLGRAKGVVYVLPELKSIDEVFTGLYHVDSGERSVRQTANL